jgi:hypothetical protein
MGSHEHESHGRWASRVALAAFVGIALFFLLTEHRAHLYGVLPYLFVLACPLMHLLHHRGHKHHRETGDER